jgi:SPX domain protein involved in polyphosphate accumulation|tara:strand:- start:536 stop:1243 length:708 start_codon:yes stop_codon:yes gene_type:complete
MIPHARFEAKYILDHFRYYRIRNALSALCRLDRFSQASPDRCYLVRTLYFDTVDYNAYSEKLAGTYERNKIRIRSYSRNRDEALVLKAEQKRRFGKKIVKYVSKISLDQYDRFMQRRSWGETEDPILIDLERIVRQKDLRPVTLVEYDREAYTARDGSGVRISFDHDVRYSKGGDLFCFKDKLRKDLSNSVILEIKTDSDNIPWLSQLVRQHSLGAEPNSKYVNAINHTQTGIWY